MGSIDVFKPLLSIAQSSGAVDKPRQHLFSDMKKFRERNESNLGQPFVNFAQLTSEVKSKKTKGRLASCTETEKIDSRRMKSPS